MPRQARMISETGYYHVIMRGVSKQILFEEDNDYYFFINRLGKYSSEVNVRVCAYCLMSNHVHLLIHDIDNNLSEMMKKLGVSYSNFFNEKYERVGHLFQGRFLSESIDNDSQFCIVLRYILNNPSKAGLCPPEKYRWSSYNEYGNNKSFVDTNLIENLFADFEQYKDFIRNQNEDECLEYKDNRRGDEWARSVIRESLGISVGTAIKGFDREKRNDAIRILKRKGVTIRQIERLTGISKGVIQKVK